MSTNKIADDFFADNVRIEKVIWLAGNMDEPVEELCDFLEDATAGDLTALFGIKVAPYGLNERGAQQEFLSRLARANKCGFLVQAATPVPIAFHGEDGFSFSWGNYTTHWFYTEALDENFVSIAVAWKATMIALYRARAEKEAAKKAEVPE